MSKAFLVLLIAFFYSYLVVGQEKKDSVTSFGVRKNVIHANIGGFLLRGACNLNYERLIYRIKDEQNTSLSARIGYGLWGVYTTGGHYQSAAMVLISGANNGHFELNFGLARMADNLSFENAKLERADFQEPPPVKSNYVNLKATGSIGYRYQKAGRGFLFRGGIGYPEYIFAGVGGAF